MTNAHSEESSQFQHEIAQAVGPTHSFGCAFKQRGAECDCLVPRRLWEVARFDGAMSRGFDYGTLTARLAEGYWEDDDEGES